MRYIITRITIIMQSESNNALIMRDIVSRKPNTIRECMHIIREHHRTVDDIESCWKDLYTNGWISLNGMFMYVNMSRQSEWSK